MFTQKSGQSGLTRLTGSSFSGASSKSLSNTSRSAGTGRGGVDVNVTHKLNKYQQECTSRLKLMHSPGINLLPILFKGAL